METIINFLSTNFTLLVIIVIMFIIILIINNVKDRNMRMRFNLLDIKGNRRLKNETEATITSCNNYSNKQDQIVYDNLVKMINEAKVASSNTYKALRDSINFPAIPVIAHTGDLIKGSDKASGYDLSCTKDFKLGRGRQVLVPTGVRIALPDYLEAVVRPRSGLAATYKISVTNTPGTIDSDYRGEIKVILINHGSKTVEFKAGDKIAQLVVQHKTDFRWIEVLEDDFEKIHANTNRNADGFGSTGMPINEVNKPVSKAVKKRHYFKEDGKRYYKKAKKNNDSNEIDSK